MGKKCLSSARHDHTAVGGARKKIRPRPKGVASSSLTDTLYMEGFYLPHGPEAASFKLGTRYAQKTELSVMHSCATIPAMAIMARRPLLISLFCMSSRPAASLGLRPSGSKPMSPGV